MRLVTPSSYHSNPQPSCTLSRNVSATCKELSFICSLTSSSNPLTPQVHDPERTWDPPWTMLAPVWYLISFIGFRVCLSEKTPELRVHKMNIDFPYQCFAGVTGPAYISPIPSPIGASSPHLTPARHSFRLFGTVIPFQFNSRSYCNIYRYNI